MLTGAARDEVLERGEDRGRDDDESLVATTIPTRLRRRRRRRARHHVEAYAHLPFLLTADIESSMFQLLNMG